MSNKLTTKSKIRVYLLNTNVYVDIPMFQNETFRDLKLKIINYVEDNMNDKQQFKSIHKNINGKNNKLFNK